MCTILTRLFRLRCVNTATVEFNSFTNDSRLKKDNVALFIELELLTTGEHVVVGTSHLYYKSKAARDQQAQCLIDEGIQFANGTQIVLCGDFNCMPQSDTIERFASAGLSSDYQAQMDEGEVATFLGGKNSKKFYDFIFHSSGLRANRLLSLPNCGETLLPNEFLSSDHVAVVEDLIITQAK